MIDLADVKRLAALGEGPRIEFKRRVPKPERIAKEVIALANSGGGKVLLGVDDDGSVVGVRDAHEERFALDQALTTLIDPPLQVHITTLQITPRRDVLVVDVPDSAARPHFLQQPDSQRRVAYVRTGSQSIEASREVIRVIRAEKKESDTMFEFGEKEHQLMQYLDRYERITVSQYARLANLPPRRASQTLVLLTRAGILAVHPNEKADYFTLAVRAG
ncbi:ATP-binding protein [soil metagenome]